MFFYLGFFLSVSFWAVRSLGDAEQKSDFVRPNLYNCDPKYPVGNTMSYPKYHLSTADKRSRR